jgi:prepilin-type N-terminal cleavage/methylation domain-containing protein
VRPISFDSAPARQPATSSRGFTLVELLVVVTIIVILMALLAPALDRAIYQAEVTVCGAQQRTVVSASVQYAMDNRRYYFYRAGVRDAASEWRTVQLTHPIRADNLRQTTSYQDDRPLFMQYFPINILVDPMSAKIDLTPQPGDDDVDDQAVFLASYNIWVGFRFAGRRGGTGGTGDSINPEQGMFRMGDRLAFGPHRLNLLISDYQFYLQSGGGTYSHPDYSGTLALGAQDQGRFTYWQGPSTHGPMDFNHGYQDGSVRRWSALSAPRQGIQNTSNPGDYPFRAVGWSERAEYSNNITHQVWVPTD